MSESVSPPLLFPALLSFNHILTEGREVPKVQQAHKDQEHLYVHILDVPLNVILHQRQRERGRRREGEREGDGGREGRADNVEGSAQRERKRGRGEEGKYERGREGRKLKIDFFLGGVRFALRLFNVLSFHKERNKGHEGKTEDSEAKGVLEKGGKTEMKMRK